MDTIFKKFIYKYMDNDLSNIFCSCSVKLLCLWAVFYSASIICFHIVMQLWCAEYASFDIACDKNNKNKNKRVKKYYEDLSCMHIFWGILTTAEQLNLEYGQTEGSQACWFLSILGHFCSR